MQWWGLFLDVISCTCVAWKPLLTISFFFFLGFFFFFFFFFAAFIRKMTSWNLPREVLSVFEFSCAGQRMRSNAAAALNFPTRIATASPSFSYQHPAEISWTYLPVMSTRVVLKSEVIANHGGLAGRFDLDQNSNFIFPLNLASVA